MDCERFREALSAELDGEDLGVSPDALRRHLRSCIGCQQWKQELGRLHRTGRLGPADPIPDLSSRILSAIRREEKHDRRRRHTVAIRLGLLLVAGLQLAIGAPDLLSGSGSGRAHLLHELGSFDLALAVGFLCAAWRPARAYGMLPLMATLAAGLAATALIDISDGHAVAFTEGTHLLDLAGFGLVWLLSRFVPDASSDPRAPVWNRGPVGAT